MKKPLFRFITVIFTAAMASCESGSEETSLKSAALDSGHVTVTIPANNGQGPLLAKFADKKLPYSDSTGFDKHDGLFELTNEEAEQLNLRSITEKKDQQYIKSFFAHYKLPFSDNFHTLVVCYQYGDNEYFSVLATYTKEFKLIDSREITYDEVAEGLLRNTSLLSEGKIRIIKTHYTDEAPTTEIEELAVGNDGRIK